MSAQGAKIGGTACKIPVVIFIKRFYTKFEQCRNPFQNFGCHIHIIDRFVNLVIAHKWIGSLREIFWLLIIVWSNCWESDRVYFMVTVSDIYDGFLNYCWSLFEKRIHSHIILLPCRVFLKITDVRLLGEDITILLHVIWSVHLHQ